MLYPRRTIALWLLAIAAVCAAIAFVRLNPGTPPSSPESPGLVPCDDTPPVVAEALDELSGSDGLEWRAVSILETPWGLDARLRPYVGRVEIRGIDVRVLDDGRRIFEQPQHDGDRLRREAGRLEGIIEERSAAGHRSSSKGATGPISPLLAPPSAVLLVSGSQILLASERVVPGAALLEDDRAATQDGSNGVTAPLPPTVAAIATDFRNEIVGAQVTTMMPVAVETPVPVRVVYDPETLEAAEVIDLRRGASGTAHVFDPNPIVTSGEPGLRDGDPVNVYRVWVPVERLEDSGRLRGEWVRVRTELGEESIEPSHVYDYVSTDPRFEQTMAYYHGDRSLERTSELGFSGLFGQPIQIVVHGTRLDNSWYSPPTREIVFGSGGVDDAEDADIIIHETGHAIHDALVPGFGGGDTRAISEGFSDFWAASLTDGACVGDWDATSYGPPCLRRVDDDVVYPGSLIGSVHKDGRIFSALLWDLREELGAELGETLALAALREQSWDSTWDDAAQALLRAADRLEIPRTRVEPHLAQRGFVARSVVMDLSQDEQARVELPVAVSFLGQDVLAFDIDGAGQIQFVDTRRTDADPAWLVPFAPEDPTGLVLSVRGSVEVDEISLDFTWKDESGAVLERSRTEWTTDTGVVSWCLVDVAPVGEPARSDSRRFWSGAALENSTPSDIDWTADGDWSGLLGFRGTHPAEISDAVGERWEVAPGDTGGFELRRTSIGRSAGDALRLHAQPSPFRESTEVRLYTPVATELSVTVYSADGRLVRKLASGPTERGLTIVQWDGRNDAGRPSPAGRYWIEAKGAGRDAVIPVVRIH
ncbi:MAG: hypothetical protein KDA27_01875 [Candidatus Eisenbacteria bacterium]|uniref:FlgD/Vpr Ig-like domain-containing protein n=1 Tax=Eiseniibacteriota bacterium TaxID=2212470 RepID=A0A956SBN1_UNCEI|nr:hypothetical protein [Candidatus Eisenbacteria bacterium]MCB9463168.1 hypothetical protein [Candidatus Eisenbacteria bacterium]